jgi:hypothetical protein
MYDKAKLGNRYVCFQCGTKFYDLNRPTATCPECGADQANAPARDVRSLLSGRGRPRPAPEPEPEPVKKSTDDDEEEDDELDDLGVDGDDDDE